MPRRRSLLREFWQPLAWLVLVALLPWWLGLPLLFALAAVAVLLQARLHGDELSRLRRALRWGLPGFLLALMRALGDDVLAVVMTLVAALAGFTLLAGLDAWLDRALRRDPEPVAEAEWPQIARAPVGPPAQIIELQPSCWGSLASGLADTCGRVLPYREGSVQFYDGTVINAVGPAAGFSADGQWFFARQQNVSGIVLWDRARDRPRRLDGWDLCGWHDGRPWVIRGDDGEPCRF